MKRFAIYDELGKFLFDIYATSKDEAIAEAKRSTRAAYRAEFVEYVRY